MTNPVIQEIIRKQKEKEMKEAGLDIDETIEEEVVETEEEPEVEEVKPTPKKVVKRRPVKRVKVEEEPTEVETEKDEKVEELEEEMVNEKLEVEEVEAKEDEEIKVLSKDKLPEIKAPKIEPVEPSKSKSKEPKYKINKGGQTTRKSFDHFLAQRLNEELPELFANEVTMEEASKLADVLIDLKEEITNVSNLRLGDTLYKLSSIKGRHYPNHFSKVITYNTKKIISTGRREVDPGKRLYGLIDDEGNFLEAKTTMNGTKRVFLPDEDGNIIFTGVSISPNN